MSTWIYYQCHSHNPPIESDGEVGQHRYDIPNAQYMLRNREAIAEQGIEWNHWQEIVLDQWTTASESFFLAHPDCKIRIFTEYWEDVTDYEETK